jgi:hypothetical protein
MFLRVSMWVTEGPHAAPEMVPDCTSGIRLGQQCRHKFSPELAPIGPDHTIEPHLGAIIQPQVFLAVPRRQVNDPTAPVLLDTGLVAVNEFTANLPHRPQLEFIVKAAVDGSVSLVHAWLFLAGTSRLFPISRALSDTRLPEASEMRKRQSA